MNRTPSRLLYTTHEFGLNVSADADLGRDGRCDKYRAAELYPRHAIGSAIEEQDTSLWWVGAAEDFPFAFQPLAGSVLADLAW